MSCLNFDFFFSSERLETRTGFCDLALAKRAKAIPVLASAITLLTASGFKYAGDTNSDSKAYTDVDKRKICIGRTKSTDEACLSLAYEMTNAKNASKFKEIREKYLSDKTPSMEKAVAYANEILLTEAEAVFNRSSVAISVGLESQVKNEKYLEIVRSNGDQSSCIDKIFSEMKKNGTVHNGNKKAQDHYIAQYVSAHKAQDHYIAQYVSAHKIKVTTPGRGAVPTKSWTQKLGGISNFLCKTPLLSSLQPQNTQRLRLLQSI